LQRNEEKPDFIRHAVATAPTACTGATGPGFQLVGSASSSSRALPGTEAQKGSPVFYAGRQTPVFGLPPAAREPEGATPDEPDANEQRVLDVQHELLDDQRSPLLRTPRRSAASASAAFINLVPNVKRTPPANSPALAPLLCAAGDAHAPLTFLSRMKRSARRLGCSST
jgi:hypothetical protein